MRRPTSLLAGLMWFDPDRPDALDHIRHNAQERDGAHSPARMRSHRVHAHCTCLLPESASLPMRCSTCRPLLYFAAAAITAIGLNLMVTSPLSSSCMRRRHKLHVSLMQVWNGMAGFGMTARPLAGRKWWTVASR